MSRRSVARLLTMAGVAFSTLALALIAGAAEARPVAAAVSMPAADHPTR